MKKSIQSFVLDTNNNQAQKFQIFKGATFYRAFYEGDKLTIQFELNASTQLETRFLAVYDSRQSVPDKYFPAMGVVSDENVTLAIFDVTHERVSNNERERELISFGLYLLSDERADLIKATPHYHEGMLKEVYHADIEQWRYRNAGVTEIE